MSCDKLRSVSIEKGCTEGQRSAASTPAYYCLPDNYNTWESLRSHPFLLSKTFVQTEIDDFKSVIDSKLVDSPYSFILLTLALRKCYNCSKMESTKSLKDCQAVPESVYALKDCQAVPESVYALKDGASVAASIALNTALSILSCWNDYLFDSDNLKVSTRLYLFGNVEAAILLWLHLSNSSLTATQHIIDLIYFERDKVNTLPGIQRVVNIHGDLPKSDWVDLLTSLDQNQDFQVSSVIKDYLRNKAGRQLLGPCNPREGKGLCSSSFCVENERCYMYKCTCLEDEEFSSGDWFSSCTWCDRDIRSKEDSKRLPVLGGGWQGCYCSWRCMLEDATTFRLSYDSTLIPKDESYAEEFGNGDSFQEEDEEESDE